MTVPKHFIRGIRIVEFLFNHIHYRPHCSFRNLQMISTAHFVDVSEYSYKIVVKSLSIFNLGTIFKSSRKIVF